MNKRGWRLLVGVLFIATVVYLLRPAGRLGFSTDSLKYIGNSDEETVELKTNEETVQLNNFSEGDEEDMIITNNNNGSESQSEVSTEIKSEKMAFITFLCDDVMVNIYIYMNEKAYTVYLYKTLRVKLLRY
jgi:hypothetical protein